MVNVTIYSIHGSYGIYCVCVLMMMYTMRGPQDSVQLVNITPITMVYGTGGFINQLITGGPHIVCIYIYVLMMIYMYISIMIYV